MSARSLLNALDGVPDDALYPVHWIRERLEDEEDLAIEIDYTLDQVGELLGVSAETVRAACVRGEFPGAYKRANREWRVPPASIRAYQEGQRVQHEERAMRDAGVYAALGGVRSGAGRGDESDGASSGRVRP